MNFPLASRREALVGAVSVAATSVFIADKSASAASGVGGINAIPELASRRGRRCISCETLACGSRWMISEPDIRR